MENDNEVDDGTVSLTYLVEQIDDEINMMEKAQAVLGPGDDKFCTYLQGYVERQALYSCITCRGIDGKISGICYACSLQCHDGHDLIELYTKRNFRCDCGNSQFPDDFKCQIEPKKCNVNDLNFYNHNFEGRYCTCGRPYPDNDDLTEDIMLQCVICEDWLHGRHATTLDLNDVDFEEMICEACLRKHPFLIDYIQICDAIFANKSNIKLTLSSDANINKKDETVDANSNFDKRSLNAESNCPTDKILDSSCPTDKILDSSCPTGKVLDPSCPAANKNLDSEVFSNISHVSVTEKLPEILSNGISNSNLALSADLFSDSKTLISENTEVQSSGCSTSKDANSDNPRCLLKGVGIRNKDYVDGAVFWPGGWRQKLCVCGDCLAMYEDQKIEFVTKSRDTLKFYESQGKSIDAIASQHITQMNHVQKIELVHGYMDFKNGLTDYLKKFQNGKIIREEDISEFFDGLQSKKKRKTE